MASLIQWSENLSVNVAEIDEQHKTLIKMIGDLNTAMLQGKGREALDSILQGLAAYAGTHFKTEERLFDRYGYPESAVHKQTHSDFVGKVGEFKKSLAANQTGLSVNVLMFLSDWLQNHIRIVDKKYSPFLIAQGVK